MSRLADLPTDKYDRLREALEEMARRRPLGDLTVRQAAQSLRLRQADILELADHSDKLELITGYRTGSGMGAIARQGDYQIQYLLEQEGLAAPTPDGRRSA